MMSPKVIPRNEADQANGGKHQCVVRDDVVVLEAKVESVFMMLNREAAQQLGRLFRDCEIGNTSCKKILHWCQTSFEKINAEIGRGQAAM